MKHTFIIKPVPPYDFDLTANYATYFRGRYATDIYEDGAFRRLLDLGGRPVLAVVRSAGSVDSPRLQVELQGHGLDDGALTEAGRRVSWLLGAQDDVAPFYRMARADEGLAQLVEAMHGLHVPHTATVYEALVLAVLGQQISTHVARMLRTLLIQTFGESLEIDGQRYFAFPRPGALISAGVEGLRGIKFSARKAEYIVDISLKVASGELDLEQLHGLPAEDVVSALTRIRGVGPWTAHWLLVRALGHPDGFPYGDLALQRTMGITLNGGTPMSAAETLAYSQRWSPYRSYVTTYLFAAVRSGRLARLAPAGEVGP